MAVVSAFSQKLPVPSPKECWDGDLKVVHSGRTEGDLDQERKLVERIRELGLLEHKVFIEKQLMTRLEHLMSQKDDMYTILDKFRRKRPLKDRLNCTISEIRKLIHPNIVRDISGNKLEYNVSILMGYFTKNIRYHVEEQCHCVVLVGETPETDDRLSKEVTLEFPNGVDMSRVTAQYSAGVFKVSVPFHQNGDHHSIVGSAETETDSVTSSLDCQSVTSSDDVMEELASHLSDGGTGSWV